METAILMDHISMIIALMELVTVSCVCYLVLLLMVESGLLLVDHQLTVTLILLVVMLCLHQLISVCIKRGILHHLMMVGTSVVYPLIVQILTLTSSLLIYSVSVVIVLVHSLICY